MSPFHLLLLVLNALFLLGIVVFLVGYILRELRQAITGYGVPFVRTPDYKMQALLEHLKLKKGQTFIDLGCGDGKILEVVSKKFPHAKIIGYESSKYPYSLALKNKKKSKSTYEVYNKDFFQVSLSEADVIYCYTIAYLMPKIWKKVEKDCKKGTLLYTNYFQIPGKKYTREIKIKDHQSMYVYKV